VVSILLSSIDKALQETELSFTQLKQFQKNSSLEEMTQGTGMEETLAKKDAVYSR
jgi:hypothetical protein